MNVVYKRIAHELKLIHSAGETYFRVCRDPNNMLDVHFTFLGPLDTPFAKGLYHGIIHLPQDYPHRPPEIVFLTASGRFETNRYICTSFTSFHPESWNPTWGIRNIIIGLRSLFAEETPGSIGSIATSQEIRERYALESHTFACKICGCNHGELVDALHDTPVPSSPKGNCLISVECVTNAAESVDKQQVKMLENEENGGFTDTEAVLHHAVATLVSGDKEVPDVSSTMTCAANVSRGCTESELRTDALERIRLELEEKVGAGTAIEAEPVNPAEPTCIDTEQPQQQPLGENCATRQTSSSVSSDPSTASIDQSTQNAHADTSASGSTFTVDSLSKHTLSAESDVDPRSKEDRENGQFRKLNFLIRIVTSVSVPPVAFNLLKRMRQNAADIRANVQSPVERDLNS